MQVLHINNGIPEPQFTWLLSKLKIPRIQKFGVCEIQRSRLLVFGGESESFDTVSSCYYVNTSNLEDLLTIKAPSLPLQASIPSFGGGHSNQHTNVYFYFLDDLNRPFKLDIDRSIWFEY